MSNVFADLPDSLPNELVEVLAENHSVRIEKIVSKGHRTPDDDWYDQDENEWVIVLRGEAKIQFEGVVARTHMRSGDFLNIPAHQRHRVEWTTGDEPTVWLAIFYQA